MKSAVAVVLSLLLLELFAFESAHAGGEEHYEKGTVYYNLQDWANALKEYRLSYEIEPKPGTLWAIAQAQRLSGDCRAAILTYRSYTRLGSPAGVAAAEELISRCQAALEEQRHAAEEPAPPPRAEAAERAPSSVHATALSSGRKVETERAWYADPLGDVLLATGLAGVAVGAFYLRTGNDDWRAAPHASDYRAYEHLRSEAQQKERIGVAALSAGLAVTALSVLRFALHGRRGHGPSRPAINIEPVGRGGQLNYRASF